MAKEGLTQTTIDGSKPKLAKSNVSKVEKPKEKVQRLLAGNSKANAEKAKDSKRILANFLEYVGVKIEDTSEEKMCTEENMETVAGYLCNHYVDRKGDAIGLNYCLKIFSGIVNHMKKLYPKNALFVGEMVWNGRIRSAIKKVLPVASTGIAYICIFT